MSFESLDKETLYRVAVEDFGADVKPTDSKKVILAALIEDGVTWDMYLKAHPELAPQEDTPVENKTTVNTTPEEVNVVPTEQVRVRTRTEPVNTASNDMYLIKMDRDNPYFEFRGYKFTQDHPYVVMPSVDADAILKAEKGFTIATPSEAAEYYEQSR